jgi:hypothetical protein
MSATLDSREKSRIGGPLFQIMSMHVSMYEHVLYDVLVVQRVTYGRNSCSEQEF